MKRPVASLPTPEQIAETPELVALHALEYMLELTLRTLVGVHPDLVDPDVPYWAIDPSRARQAAHRLVMVASHLELRIQEYLTALELDQQTNDDRREDDLSF
jgi:hypothetical protein